MINGVTTAHAADGRAAGNARAQGVSAVRTNVFDLRKVDAVFIAKRQVTQQVFERVDAALGKEFRSLRTDAFEHSHFGFEAFGHTRFISLAWIKPELPGKPRSLPTPDGLVQADAAREQPMLGLLARF